MTEDCRRFDEGLLDLCYSELSEELSARLREHASQCPRCQKELESYMLLRRLTQQLPSLEPPQRIDAKILEASLQRAKELSMRSATSDFAKNHRYSFFDQIRWLLRPSVWVLSGAAALLAIGVYIATVGQTEKSSLEEEPIQLAVRPNDEEFAPLAFPTPENPSAYPVPEEVIGRDEAPPVSPPAASSWPQASAQTGQPKETRTSPRRKASARTAHSEASPKASKPPLEGMADNRIAGAPSPSQKSFSSTHQSLDHGLAAYRRGDCDSAKPDLEFVASDTHSSTTDAATALHALARCEKRQGGCRGAISLYQRLLRDFPRYLNRVEALQEASICYRELGQTRQAQSLQDEIDAAGPMETH
jgi:tetratricopeptide (TPR) repeat protein